MATRFQRTGPRRTSWEQWPGPASHVSVEFRAPLRYVFDWCTDFSPMDGPIGREPYLRKIIFRTPRLVVLEDLEPTPHGWDWARLWVKLRPPDRWECETIGNYHDFTINYQLRALTKDRTGLDLFWKLRSRPLERRRPGKRSMERGAQRAWRFRKLALERAYRAGEPAAKHAPGSS